MKKKIVLDELLFCMKLWKEQGHCAFGGHTNCEGCGAPYILYKQLTGKVLHDPKMRRLSREEWETKINKVLAIEENI